LRSKNLVLWAAAAAYFVATSFGQKVKLGMLVEKLLVISQRFFDILSLPFLSAGR
jgi:hypothetical protein